MKRIILKSVSCLVLSLVIMTSCQKFLDINDSPNNPLEVPLPLLLPTSIAGTAFASSNELNRFGSTIMSVTAAAGGISTMQWDIYNVTGGEFGNQWNLELYGGALINFQKIIDQATANNSMTYAGVAKIMKAFTFAMITDTWGDVPYSQALLGDQDITTPRLDQQRDIYLGNAEIGIQSLFDLVREGLRNLEEQSVFMISGDDLIYGGDLDKWRRAGNSIMLKLAIQISSVEPELATQVIQEVLERNTYIVSNEQNLSMRFGAQAGSQSPIFFLTNISAFRNDLMISERFVTLLQSKNDPRLPQYVTSPTGEYITLDNGFRGTPPAVEGRSVWNTYVTGQSGEGPTRLLTNAQTAFILAEAIVRLGITGSAEEQFQRGIRASMQDAGLTASVIDAYFNDNPEIVTLSGSTNQQLAQILTQKYIALFGNGLEQWNDWRRTGFPELAEHQNAVGVDGTRPRRLMYLFTEQQRNPNFPQGTNVPQANVPVWWDAN